MHNTRYQIDRCPLRTVIFCLLFICIVGTALGQNLRNQGYIPIDKMVEDIEPAAYSSRVMSSACNLAKGFPDVFRTSTTNVIDQRYYYISQGVIASFDRSQYAMTRQGSITQVIPPNTIFYLSLPNVEQDETPVLPPSPNMVNAVVNSRVQLKTNTKVNARIQAVNPSYANVSHNAYEKWDVYQQLCDKQRIRVIRTINQMLTQLPMRGFDKTDVRTTDEGH